MDEYTTKTLVGIKNREDRYLYLIRNRTLSWQIQGLDKPLQHFYIHLEISSCLAWLKRYRMMRRAKPWIVQTISETSFYFLWQPVKTNIFISFNLLVCGNLRNCEYLFCLFFILKKKLLQYHILFSNDCFDFKFTS